VLISGPTHVHSVAYALRQIKRLKERGSSGVSVDPHGQIKDALAHNGHNQNHEVHSHDGHSHSQEGNTHNHDGHNHDNHNHSHDDHNHSHGDNEHPHDKGHLHDHQEHSHDETPDSHDPKYHSHDHSGHTHAADGKCNHDHPHDSAVEVAVVPTISVKPPTSDIVPQSNGAVSSVTSERQKSYEHKVDYR
jgi:hypothetical protein